MHFKFNAKKVFFKTPEGAAGAANPAAGATGGAGGGGAAAGAGAGQPGAAGAGTSAAGAAGAQGQQGQPQGGAQGAQKPEGEVKTLLGQEGEVKPEGDKPKVGETAKPKVDVAALKLPEGRTIDKVMMEKYVPLMEKHGLSQEAAQEFLSLGDQMIQSLEAKGHEQWTTKVNSWETAIKADPEVGGPKLKESIGLAVKGARSLGGAELIKELDDSGFGNNPVIFKALVKAGRLIKEDTVAGATQTGTGELTQEEKDAQRFPKMNQQLNARAAGGK
jgi:hypothetical protein